LHGREGVSSSLLFILAEAWPVARPPKRVAIR
jgi:hypothetical protein